MWFKKGLGVKTFSHKIGTLFTYYGKNLRQGTGSHHSKGVKISASLFPQVPIAITFLLRISTSCALSFLAGTFQTFYIPT
jgi:hypothetical protein